jgi:hypothetical protein
MAYEFKKLSDVEVTAEPTESANVLIEEDGVIKKTPKTAVGGASVATVEWDAVINLGVYSSTSNLSDLSGGSAPDYTVAMITEKLHNGEMPKIKGIITYSYYDHLYKSVFEFTAFGEYGKDQARGYCDIFPYTGHYSLQVNLRDHENGSTSVSVTVL